MRRLSDYQGDDPVLERAAELWRAESRVWRARPTRHAPRTRTQVTRFRPGLVLAVLVATTGMAIAGGQADPAIRLVRSWLRADAPAPAPASTPARAPRVRRRPAAPPKAATPVVVAPLAPVAEPVPTALPAAAPEPVAAHLPPSVPSTTARARRPAPPSPQPEPPAPTPPAAAPAVPDGVPLVYAAAREMRNCGSAERALALVLRYRSEYPSGLLAEEALGLAVEAAVRLDDPRRTGLARDYVREYPGGRYSALSGRVLSGGEP